MERKGHGATRATLRELAEQLTDIRGRLAEGAEEQPAPSAELARVARAIYVNRRKRERWFLPELFGEPAWDILLDLYASDWEGRKVSISSMCAGAGVPPTTGLRWIGSLEERGYLERVRHATDKRSYHLRLTTEAYALMSSYLRAHGSL